MLNDTLSNALSMILNSERTGKTECLIKPVSSVIKKVLALMKENNYLGDIKETTDSRGNYIKVNLLGNLNNCNTVKPRYAVRKEEFEKFEKRYLPAKDIGIILVSTSKGIMTHYDAKKKNLGGKLLAYCY